MCGERGRVGANVRIGGSTPGGRLSLSPQRRPVGVVGRSCTDSRIRTRPSSSDDRIDALAQASRRPKTRLLRTLHAIRTSGGPFSSRHRIIDTAGDTHSVIVVGDSVVDESGAVVGSSGFYIDVTETLDSTVKASVDVLVNEITASRGVIEQAKGMLMVIYGISADRAFDILVWRSQETNVKLRDVAEQLIVRTLDDFRVPTLLRTRFGSRAVTGLNEKHG